MGNKVARTGCFVRSFRHFGFEFLADIQGRCPGGSLGTDWNLGQGPGLQFKDWESL